ncbi:MAG: regulatory protein GemA [Desulfobacterales bacterium]|nr:regulatory protein GemA [Desulfobacterales bacterium]
MAGYRQSTRICEGEADRQKELAKIHIGRKELGLDEGTYREMLQNIAGVSSARDLDKPGRLAVLDHMKACGFKQAHRSARASGMHVSAPNDRNVFLCKIEATLAELRLPWSYADGMARRMFKIDRVRWLNPSQLQKLMVGLIYISNRRS